MSESKRTRNIAFRINDEEYAKIEQAAAAVGEEPNNWCRKVAFSKLTEGHTFTTNERLIYQEVALLRFLVGHGSRCCSVKTTAHRQNGKSSLLKLTKDPKRS
jgi:hypothetical protein